MSIKAMDLRAGISATLLGIAITAAAAPIHERMTLVEAIEAVRDLDFEIIYSSQLVEEWMLVRSTPAEEEPVAALRSALAVYDLDIVAGPGGRWLIVAADTSPSPMAPQPADERQAAGAGLLTGPTLEEIVIVGSRHSLYKQGGGGDQFLSGEDIRLLPHIADDAFRALHKLPGVAANDFQAPFHLRGGSPDEVKVQLDGLEIIEPFHMRTLFRPLSIIDPGIIKDAQVLSGGFTAEHGNYMSGVVDIVTQQAASEPEHELGVSFVSAFARSRGQFANGRGSYFFSARRGYLDLIAEQVVDEGEELQPRYADLFGRASYMVSDTSELSLRVLLAEDDVRFIDPGDGEDFSEDGSMSYLWLTADIEPAPGISSINTVFTSRVETEEDGTQFNPPSENIARFFYRDVRSAGIKSDWLIARNDRHMLSFGARYRDLSTDYDYRLSAGRASDFVNNGAPFFVNRAIQTSVDGEDASAYAAYRMRLTDRLIGEVGVRWDKQAYGNTRDDSQVSPRINAVLQLNDRAEVRIAWGEFYQPQAIQDLQVSDGDLRFYEPELAEQTILGLRQTFANGLQLQADTYYKRYRDLRPRYENLLDIYEYAPESNFDRVFLDPDAGRSYGAELTLRGSESSLFNWWASYTWSKVEDEFDGTHVPRSWDQRHAASASISWSGELWSFTAIARYHSGWPRTPLIATPVLDSAGDVVGVDVDLTQRNTDRFDSYLRVDFRASRRVPLQRGSFEYYLELFNVFDAENQCCTTNHTLNIGPSVTVAPEFDEYLPLFPSFGFVWRFGPGADD